MKWLITLCFFFNILVLAGCSDKQETSGGGEHVWKEQTGAIDRAKDVEKKVMDQANTLQKQIEGQSR